jgi:peptidoglycan LD-endopeptidase LytH
MLRKRKISISQALTIAILIAIVQVCFTQLLAHSEPLEHASQHHGQKVDSVNKPPEYKIAVSDAQLSAAIKDLAARNLLLPVEGVSPENLKGSFFEKRGDTTHGAADIVAPRNTPVKAVEDGTIGKLFQSRFGGNTIYQIDPSGQYVYYYAHLEKYEPTLKEGDKVKRGQVIGFVGTSGNAPPNTPHLHFSISVLTPEKKWWQARALDPYEVYKTHNQKR